MIHDDTFCLNSVSWVVPASLSSQLHVFQKALAGGPLALPTAHRLEVAAAPTRRAEAAVRLCPRAHPSGGVSYSPTTFSHLEMPHAGGPTGNVRPTWVTCSPLFFTFGIAFLKNCCDYVNKKKILCFQSQIQEMRQLGVTPALVSPLR